MLADGCGGSGDSSGACNAFKVVNGQECAAEGTPVVRLLIDGGLLCTGTVVADDYVLTAAHCAEDASDSVEVFHDRGEQRATRAFVNPLAQVPGLSSAFDVGIVEVPGIRANLGVTAASISIGKDVKVGDRIQVVGYGGDGSASLPNGNPRATELPVLAVENGVIVTNFDSTQSGVCFGDSGASATLDGEVVAVVSGGSGCDAGNDNRFSRLRNQGNVDFLATFPGVLR